MLQKVRQVGHLGLQVGHLGHILAPSWPTWRHLGAKMRPNSHPNGAPDALQIASWASLAPRGSPRTSKVSWSFNFQQFFFNFGPNSIDFSNSFLQFPAAGSARWRLGARSALDISAGPAKRRHGVLNLVSNPPSPSSLDLSKFKL